MSEIFTYTTVVKETLLDSFGHVNNAAYLILLEEARWDFMNKGSYGLKRIRSTGVGPTILEMTIKFSKELHARDEIIIESQILSYKRKIGILSQKILRNGEVCCSAELVLALFSLKERKLIVPTKEWLHAIGYEDQYSAE